MKWWKYLFWSVALGAAAAVGLITYEKLQEVFGKKLDEDLPPDPVPAIDKKLQERKEAIKREIETLSPKEKADKVNNLIKQFKQ